MLKDSKVVQFRQHLKRLSYPEYAYRRESSAVREDGEPLLDLSLWNDKLPPGVVEAMSKVLPKVVGTYALAQDSTLIAMLAQQLGVANSSVIITAGADGALRVAARYSIRPKTRVVIPVPCFGRYAYHAMVNEADIRYLAFSVYPYEFDIAKIIAVADKSKANCIFIASPNNPTGHIVPPADVQRLLDAVGCTVILDESLLLSTRSASQTALIEKHPNLFICGSFSKLYGLAGLRIGYLVAHPMHTEQLRQLVSPFEVDALALEIAKYVMTQEAWIRKRIATITEAIAVLHTINNPQVRVSRTQAPVALLDYPDGKESLYQILLEAGVLTVDGREFPGLAKSNTVRVIINNIQRMQRLKRIVTHIS